MKPRTLSQLVVESQQSQPEPLWVPTRSETLTSSDVLHQTRTLQPLQADLEAAIVAILHSPTRSHETHVEAGARREAAAMEIMAQLDPAQAFHVGRRLDIARPDDPIVVAFRRVTPERRARMRRFLADAKRRAAVGQCLRLSAAG